MSSFILWFFSVGIAGTLLSSSSAAEITGQVLEAGLAKLPAVEKNAELELTFKLVSEDRCFFADRDAIGMEFARSRSGTKLLLTLEPLGNLGVSTMANDITAAGQSLTSGFESTFLMKKPARPVIFGVYICKSPPDSRTCAEKKIIPIQEVLDTYNTAKQKLPESFRAEDKVYFFKFLILTDQWMFVPTEPMTLERYALLERMLSEIGFGDAKEEMRYLKKIGSILGSRPFALEQSAIILRLPGFNPPKCR